LWLKALRKEFELVSSRRILSDFLKVIGREKFQTYLKERDNTWKIIVKRFINGNMIEVLEDQ
jgi:predicted nucleic acid-binding protein